MFSCPAICHPSSVDPFVQFVSHAIRDHQSKQESQICIFKLPSKIYFGFELVGALLQNLQFDLTCIVHLTRMRGGVC
jgi:hypothetical protein